MDTSCEVLLEGAELGGLLGHSSFDPALRNISVKFPNFVLFVTGVDVMTEYPSFNQAREAIRLWSETGLAPTTRVKQAKLRGIDCEYLINN